MRDVFVHQDHARVGFYKSVLDDAGIATFVRNENGNYMAQVPLPLMDPVLCVVNDEDYDEAMRLLEPIYYEKLPTAADWHCAKCGEEVPGAFDACWHCGELRAEKVTDANGGSDA